ncbi:MAG TPA: hypothetical protein VFG86_23445 [Chloroflexota bacterium]|nr:hypothetical protein [Chloroflexota bacterium]
MPVPRTDDRRRPPLRLGPATLVVVISVLVLLGLLIWLASTPIYQHY